MHFITIVGVILIALGTFFTLLGDRIQSQRNTAQLLTWFKSFEEGMKSISEQHVEQAVKSITNEQEILLIINNLTLPQKYDLLLFASGYGMVKIDEEMMYKRWVKAFKPPVNLLKNNPFKDAIDSLVGQELIEMGDDYVKLTPKGLKVVTIMLKNKIPPFDINQ